MTKKTCIAPCALGLALAAALFVGKAAEAKPTAGEDRAARRAAAEVLFDEGRTLVATGRYDEACPKFAESERLDPAVGTRLNLADCLEKLGRTASAWVEFRAAAGAAREKRQWERETLARARAAALEPKLARLVVTVQGGDRAPDLEVRKDGAPLGRALWGTAVPVDPGKHVLEAKAKGKRPFRLEVEVPPGAATRVATTIPELEDADRTPPKSPGRAQKIAAVAVGGAGIVSLVAGSILGAQAMARNEASNAHCIDGNLCDATGVSLRSEAMARGNAATGAFVAGALAATGGLVLYLTAPTETNARLGAGKVGSGAGLVLGGSF